MAPRLARPARQINGLHPGLLKELAEEENDTDNGVKKKANGASRSRTETQRPPPTSTRMFGRKNTSRPHRFAPVDCTALPRMPVTNRTEKRCLEAVSSAAWESDEPASQQPLNNASLSNDETLRRERTVKYPDRILSANEYDDIKRQMREFISEAPNTNTGWRVLVDKFLIGYLQAREMCTEIMRAPTAPSSVYSAVSGTTSSLSRTNHSVIPRKRIRETGEWLSQDQTEEIKLEMKPLLIPHVADGTKVDYNDLACRFDLSEAQAIEIANELIFLIRNEPSRAHQLRVKEQEQQERRMRAYPNRFLTDEERRELKRAMRRLPFDDFYAGLGDNKWFDLADRNRLNMVTLVELRREIHAERLRSPSSRSDYDEKSGSHALCRTPSMYSGVMDDKPTQAETSDTELMNAERNRMDIAARTKYFRTLSHMLAKIERLYKQKFSSEVVAQKLQMPLVLIQELLLKYLCHMLEARCAEKKSDKPATPLTCAIKPHWILDAGRIKQVLVAMKSFPFATVVELAGETKLHVGTIRAIALHKLRMWRDDAYADLYVDSEAAGGTRKDAVAVDMPSADAGKPRWRAATDAEIAKNGFVGFDDNDDADAILLESDDDDEAVAMLSGSSGDEPSPPQVRPKMRTRNESFAAIRARKPSSSYQSCSTYSSTS